MSSSDDRAQMEAGSADNTTINTTLPTLDGIMNMPIAQPVSVSPNLESVTAHVPPVNNESAGLTMPSPINVPDSEVKTSAAIDPSASISQNHQDIIARAEHQKGAGNSRYIQVRTEEARGILIKSYGEKQSYIMPEQGPLFDQIVSFHNANPDMNNYMEAMRRFGEEPLGDAMVKLVYGTDYYDYILKYKNDLEKDKDKDIKIEERIRYEVRMVQNGLVFEKELTKDKAQTYIKVVAPFFRLCQEAEKMALKFELREDLTRMEAVHEAGGLAQMKHLAQNMAHMVNFMDSAGDSDILSAPFVTDKLSNFERGSIKELGFPKVQSEFFTSARRILTTNHVLTKCKIEKAETGKKVGVMILLRDGVFTEFFPCHDGPESFTGASENMRATLNMEWAALGKIFRQQPLDDVRDYFGSKVAFYFAFIGFYTVMLAFASLLGIIVFLYGISAYYNAGATTNDFNTAVSRMFDNDVTLAYTFIMSIWATVFLEYFKRYTMKQAYQWDTIGYEKEEVTRPEFKPSAVRKSPVTGKWEKYEPTLRYKAKMMISAIIVCFSIAVVIGVIVGTIYYRVRLSNGDHSAVISITSSLISVVAIVILGMIYDNIAIKLTDWENHRTETEYENAKIAKKFMFGFVNYYGSLLYIGLLKNILSEDAGFEDPCYDAPDIGGKSSQSCMVDLTQQLVIIFIGKQIINQMVESGTPIVQKNLPLIMEKLGLSKPAEEEEEGPEKDEGAMIDTEELPQHVKDDALVKYPGTLDEYNEMAVQFGFVMLFVSSFPLGSVFALLNNIFEIRFDAKKLVEEYQRPVPYLAANIGVWHRILTVVSYVAVLTNAGLIALTSEHFDAVYLAPVGDNRAAKRLAQLGFIVAYEHVVFALKEFIAVLIPDTPERIKDSLKREEYISATQIQGLPPAEDDPEALEQAHAMADNTMSV